MIKIFFYITFFYVIIHIIFNNNNTIKYNYYKYDTIKYIPKKYIPDTILFDINKNNINILKDMNYPIIIKPNNHTIGHLCNEVFKSNNFKESLEFIKKYKNKYNNFFYLNELLIQSFIPFKNEIGVLFQKNIFTNKGVIVSIILKKSKNTDIICGCLGKDNYCIDITNIISNNFKNLIINITNNIKGFEVGRYDIKFKDIKSLNNCKDFYILELNNHLSSDLRINMNFINFKFIKYGSYWTIFRFMNGLENIKNGKVGTVKQTFISLITPVYYIIIKLHLLKLKLI